MKNQDETIWSIAEGKMANGEPYILRFREFYPTEEERQKYSFLIEITWQYEEENESGMPYQDDYQKMVDLEDIIDEQLELQKFCLLMASIIGGGKKIWQIYTTDADLFMDKFNEAMSDREVLPLEIELLQDEEWNGYKEVVSWVE